MKHAIEILEKELAAEIALLKIANSVQQEMAAIISNEKIEQLTKAIEHLKNSQI